MLNQLSNFAPLCRFRRCALCHLRTAEFRDSRDVTTSRPPRPWTHTGHTGLTASPNLMVCLASAERQIQLLLRCQVAVVHVDHQLLNENRLAGSDCLFPKHDKNVQRLHMFTHINEDPRVVELVVFVFFMLHQSHLMSSQQHSLSSKYCSCSKARPNKPMLRPEQRAPHLFQIPSSNPDLPIIQSTKHPRPFAWEANEPKLQSPQVCP